MENRTNLELFAVYKIVSKDAERIYVNIVHVHGEDATLLQDGMLNSTPQQGCIWTKVFLARKVFLASGQGQYVHDQEWILPTIMENYIGESLHKQEFSIDYPSPRWSFPVIPPKNVFFRWCSFH